MNENEKNASQVSAPTTPGQAEGSLQPEQQSQPSPSPSQLEPVEGGNEDSNQKNSDEG